MANSNTTSSTTSTSPEPIISSAALVISLIALITTSAQALQQYCASAEGYAHCNEKVMGLWAKHTRRIFRPSELRFEVWFEVPVIFLAPPDNMKRPVPEHEIWYMDGSDQSCRLTRIKAEEEEEEEKEERTLHPGRGCFDRDHARELIHTADNERATWLTLLSALQLMERDSNGWQNMQYKLRPNGYPVFTSPPLSSGRTLAVAVQSKTRSWDTITQVKKPYATTTLCHLIEMVAVLGLYWKEFNQSSERYRAEGNGYMISGTMISDLGIMFSFHKVGETTFRENRIIPVNEVKELCFGYVPTIFRNADDFIQGLKYPADAEEKPGVLHTLQLGSAREISGTLALLGCNANTQNYYLDDRKIHTHLFPVTFELMGMLARPFHIRQTSFRMLPNPTIDYWDSKALNLPHLLTAFKDRLENQHMIARTDQIDEIRNHIEAIEAEYTTDPSSCPYKLLDALHGAIDTVDAYLACHLPASDVLDTIRLHIQDVLGQLNKGNTFEKLNTASPYEKEAFFMDIYFEKIRPTVVNRAPPVSPQQQLPERGSPYSPKQESEQRPSQQSISPEIDPSFRGKANNIWCMLMFRMLCWLTLHDFHKKDVQIPKGELLGSRLPVYIA